MSVLQPGKHLIQNNQKKEIILCASGVSYKYRQAQALGAILIPKNV